MVSLGDPRAGSWQLQAYPAARRLLLEQLHSCPPCSALGSSYLFTLLVMFRCATGAASAFSESSCLVCTGITRRMGHKCKPRGLAAVPFRCQQGAPRLHVSQVLRSQDHSLRGTS